MLLGASFASDFAAFPTLAVPAASIRCGDGAAAAAVVMGGAAAAVVVVVVVIEAVDVACC